MCSTKLKTANAPINIAELITQGDKIVVIVKEKASQMAKIEGLEETEAMRKLAFFECFKCKVPYYGGRRECAEEMERKEEQKAEDFICAFCKEQGEGAGMTVCNKHGIGSITYKCRYCCSLAIWYCFGTSHLCEPCHRSNYYG